MNRIDLRAQGNITINQGIYSSNPLIKGQPSAKTAINNNFSLEKATKDLKIGDRTVTRPIYLIGENHYTQDSQNELAKNLFHLAAKQRLVYAVEGLERDILAEQELKDMVHRSGIEGMSKGYLYGVEDPFFNLFNTALDLNHCIRMDFLKSEENIGVELSELIRSKKNDLLCSLVSKASQQHLEEFWNNIVSCADPISQFLFRNKELLIQETFENNTKNFNYASKHEKWYDIDWFCFTKEITLILAEKLRIRLSNEKIFTLDILLANLKSFGLKWGPYESANEDLLNFNRQLHLTLKNDFIAENLKTVHALTEDIGKSLPVVSILGLEHIPGITETLSKEGYTVQGKKELVERLKSL